MGNVGRTTGRRSLDRMVRSLGVTVPDVSGGDQLKDASAKPDEGDRCEVMLAA